MTGGIEARCLDTRAMSRAPLAFIAWSHVSGRSAEIAAELDGEARCFYSPHLVRRPLVPLRYAVSALQTTAYLLRRRPRAVIVSNPPIFPGLIAFAYGSVARAPIVLDSHTGSFGLKQDRVSQLLLPIHVWLARRVAATLVAAEELGEIVRGWGGRAHVVHEAPPTWAVNPPAPLGDRPHVLCISTFDPDEAVDQVIAAGRMLPFVDLRITGDLRRCPAALRRSAPPNVTFVGFLRGEDYTRALEAANIVIALTTEPTSVVRGGYEAVYAGRPLVTSNWPTLRRVFPRAVHVETDAPSIAAGLRTAIDRYADLVASAPTALALQKQRWDRQVAVLRSLFSQGPLPGAQAGAARP